MSSPPAALQEEGPKPNKANVEDEFLRPGLGNHVNRSQNDLPRPPGDRRFLPQPVAREGG